MARSRQHVVITRLNDKEYEIYERVLTRVRKEFGHPKNDSEALRLALLVIDHKLTEEAMQYFYEHCLDIGVERARKQSLFRYATQPFSL